jgi:hypothetical protein
MAVDTNAVTLADYALMSNDPRVQAITSSLIDNGSVMARDIPFVTVPTLKVNGTRWEGNLPTVDWVPINAEGAVTKGTPTPFDAQAYIIRNKIQVDKFIDTDQNQIGDPMGNQVAAWAWAQAYDFNDKFINNSHITGDPHAIVGLRARLDNASTFGIRAANNINGNLTLTTGATAANVNAALEVFDELLWAVGAADGQNVVIYANDVFIRRLHFALRVMGSTGGLSTAQDQFDRVITMYKGAQIRDIGYKADQATRIITRTETAAGLDGSSTYTSVYAVNYGPGRFYGFQMAPLYVSPPFMTEGGAVKQVNIDWAGGLIQQHSWAIARVYGINLG